MNLEYNSRTEVVVALGHLKVMQSIGIDRILDMYFESKQREAETGDKITVKKFWEKFVKAVNPSITYHQWMDLDKRIKGHKKRGKFVKKVDEPKGGEVKDLTIEIVTGKQL